MGEREKMRKVLIGGKVSRPWYSEDEALEAMRLWGEVQRAEAAAQERKDKFALVALEREACLIIAEANGDTETAAAIRARGEGER